MTTLNDRIEFRINEDAKSKFIEEAEKLGKPYQMLLREFITAFNKDQLRIHGREYKELYSDD